MKESKVEEFLNKVDRPWGMSKQELEQLQKEVSVLKSYKDRYELAIVPSEYIISDKSIIRKYILGGEEKFLTLKDMQDYLNMYASDCADKHQAILILKEEIEQLKSVQNKVAIEKLEELRARFDNSPIIFFHDTELNERERKLIEDEYEDAKLIFRDNIDQLLAELKGEK